VNSIINDILNGPGNAQHKLERIYGKHLSYHNAALYLAGIKLHINKFNKIVQLEPEMQYDIEKHQEKTTEGVTFKVNKDKSTTIQQDIYLTDEEASSPHAVMAKMGLDPILWEVLSYTVEKGSWDTTMKLDNSEIIDGILVKSSQPHTVQNRKCSVSLRVKPTGGNLTFPQVLEAFKELEPASLDTIKHKTPTSDSLLFELPMMDAHFGKLAWWEESGADYDLKVAEYLWVSTIEDLIEKALKFGKFEQIIFPIGQDLFHYDTPKATTTNGTQLTTDTRWQKMFRKGVDMLVWSIEKLRKIAPVEILWTPGNHDRMLSYAAVVGLAQRYSKTDSVIVDLTATSRKYRLFGKNLIGYSHGEQEGKRLQGLMQIEAPELWGKSIFREFHLGHLHTEMLTTVNGIGFRRIGAITANDAWHTDNGFVGSTRLAQAFIWHKDFGLQAVLNSNVIKRINDI